ncbi:hypothetical protein H072_2406 [Dactylellina haptotyla CBS 200.50]|uniref:BTB domain-containing protein n=1 Tax=Dactylellina haptotyla (strain CBS 200.50) TaxID=1284197 RepID=S8AL17_DACHA|nr:hypothetical protein H072_2406 [Dactylellina haptotyla CBS 200.50]
MADALAANWLADIYRLSAQMPDPNFNRPPAKTSSGGETPPTDGEATLSTDVDCIVTALQRLESPLLDREVLCPTSDVLIKLANGNEIHYYLASSQILSLVSPVWRKGLDPDSPFKKKIIKYNGREITVLDLEDNDQESLAMILRCSHFQMDRIPSTLSFERLKRLAIVCDKYDCAKVFKPWFDGWLARWENDILTPGHEDWLFIAKVFESTNFVTELISLLIENSSSLSECGTYIKVKDVDVPVELIFNFVTNEIEIERERRIEISVSKLRNLLKGFFEDSRETAGWCSFEGCQSLVYGSFIRSIRKSGLWELLNGDQVWYGSLNELHKRFATITYTVTDGWPVTSLFVCISHKNNAPPGLVSSRHSCKFVTEKCRLLSTLTSLDNVL